MSLKTEAIKKFLTAAKSLADQGMSKEAIEKFARNEFGQISELFQKQIDSIFKMKSGIGELFGFKNFPKKDEVFDDTVIKLPVDDTGQPFNPRDPLKDYSKKPEDKATGGRAGYAVGNQVTPQVDARMNLDYNTLLDQNEAQRSFMQNWRDHATASQAMKGKAGLESIPNYGMQSGYDFQKKFNYNPKTAAVLGAGYQLATEGLGMFNPKNPNFLNPIEAFKTAQSDATKNIEGILAAESNNLTAEQQADRNKYLERVGQPKDPVIDQDRISEIVEQQKAAGVPDEGLVTNFNKPTMADVSGPSPDAAETYSEYKARMLEAFRKSHRGQKTATTDLQPDGSYSGVSREIPIEDYFNYMLADAYGHGFNPITGLQFGTDDRGVFTNQYNFNKEMADFKKNNPDYNFVNLASGGRARHYTGGIVDIEPNLSDIGHGSDALMSRTRLMSPGSQATTSTGLNYLLAEDNDNIRVPFAGGGSDRMMSDEEKAYNLMRDAIDKENYLKKRRKEMQMDKKKFEETKYGIPVAEGGRIGFSKGKIAKELLDKGRRGFMKTVGSIGAGIAGLKAGLLGFGDQAAPVAEDVIEKVAQSAQSVPPYFLNLVKKIKNLGARSDGYKERSESFTYKDYVMDIDYDTGAIEIKKTKEAMIPGGDEAGISEEVYMTYKPGMADETTKGKKVVDEYEEYTARPDMDGKMKDVEAGVTDEVIEEGTMFEDNITDFKKAEGGRIGYSKGKAVLSLVEILKDPKKIREAIDNIFKTGDYKMDAEMAAESLVELNPQAFGGKLYDDLDDKTRMQVYGAVIDDVMKDFGKKIKDKKTDTYKFLEKVFGKENMSEMPNRDPLMYEGLKEVVPIFRQKDKARKKQELIMYMQKYLPHMDDAEIEAFIKGSDGTEGLQGQLIRLGSGRDYAEKMEMMKNLERNRSLRDLEVTEEMKRKPNASGGLAKLLGE